MKYFYIFFVLGITVPNYYQNCYSVKALDQMLKNVVMGPLRTGDKEPELPDDGNLENGQLCVIDGMTGCRPCRQVVTLPE